MAIRPNQEEERSDLSKLAAEWAASKPVDMVLAAKLDLPYRTPPNPIDATKPSESAIQHGLDLAAKVAIPAVERYYRLVQDSAGTRTSILRPGSALENGRLPWRVQLPAQLNIYVALIGLPLVGSLSPEAWDHIVRLRVSAEFLGRLTRQTTNKIRRVVTEAIGLESELWAIAGSESGWRNELEIPYCFRWLALGWLWHPDAHQPGPADSLCIRCGTRLHRARAQTKRRPFGPAPAPLCAHCAKTPSHAREWPANAIAPAGRGSWWLQCQTRDCPVIFRADRRAQKCSSHKSAALSNPQRRRAREAEKQHSQKAQ